MFLRARQQHLEAVETGLDGRSGTHPGVAVTTKARHDALMDKAVAVSLTLMACRALVVDGETAELVEAAIEGCDRIAAHLGALARQEGDHTYLFADDLREIDELASAIYAHVTGP